MDIKKLQFFGLTLVLFAGAVFSATTADLTSGLSSLCTFINGVIPIIVMLMLVGAGAVYAGGQMMGAETRARANVWATSMLTGALIGIVIVAVAPGILTTMYSGGTTAWTCTSAS
ncbi:hypothetical protein COV61_01345 [Candidatus Micrarchaeota archaeon CG11_big_fil_rev_8_21_14_0_20_47_5]|nr:MAG: hypothetical protein AUJ17_03395 [Candidatus Micrarchaeota archaeon CG1_02_47_40]PIN84045.1 MAG: hypothetical protein COV61_01345 [Candidatus Micrarchaeota archaeon CG11_big_fil_rev_8_21_14_0_20_47_5]